MPFSTRTRCLFAARLAGLLLAAPAAAQSVTIGAGGVADAHDLGRAFQTFPVFGGTPGIAAAQYYSDFSINNLQLPVRRTFAPMAGGPLADISPYAELTLDYLSASNVFPLTTTGISPYNVRLSFNSWSGLAGFGAEVPLAPGLRLRPIDMQPGGRAAITSSELGAGLQYVNADAIPGVRGATVRASAIAGPGVIVWLVSAALDF